MDGATFGLDEATLSLQLSAMTTLIAGRTAVPFGSFDTNMVSNPLTLALGETSETAFMLAFAEREVTASFYTFRGDADVVSATTPDDDALSYGANVSYVTAPLTMGVSYISNIIDSDGLQSPGQPGALTSEVPGMAVNLTLNMNNSTFIAEHVAASSGHNTVEGHDGMALKPGMIVVAPGGTDSGASPAPAAEEATAARR